MRGGVSESGIRSQRRRAPAASDSRPLSPDPCNTSGIDLIVRALTVMSSPTFPARAWRPARGGRSRSGDRPTRVDLRLQHVPRLDVAAQPPCGRGSSNGAHLVLAVRVVDAHHRHGVLHRLQLRCALAADALGGRVFRARGVGRLEVDQLLHEPVVLAVGQFRPGLDVVEVVRTVERLAQLGHPLGDVGSLGHESSGGDYTGGRAASRDGRMDDDKERDPHAAGVNYPAGESERFGGRRAGEIAASEWPM